MECGRPPLQRDVGDTVPCGRYAAASGSAGSCGCVGCTGAAVRSALNNTAKVILKDHVEHCLADAVESGDMEAIEQLNRAIEQFMN